MRHFENTEELFAYLESLTPVIPRMKGRKYKARMRSEAKWYRNPVLRCKCGSRKTYAGTRRACPFRRCVLYVCTTCGRVDGGWGPIGCPCDRGGWGHLRYEELPKPRITRK